LQAAILSVKLKHLPAWTQKRQEAALRYNELLKDCDVQTPAVSDTLSHVYHLYVVRAKDRDLLQAAFNAAKTNVEINQ